MIVVVSENSSDSKGKGQILSSSQQIGSNDKVASMGFKVFSDFQDAVWSLGCLYVKIIFW